MTCRPFIWIVCAVAASAVCLSAQAPTTYPQKVRTFHTAQEFARQTQGRIVVEKSADQTDARMGHHALILSDKAEIDAKPELLIFADDVSCAHGNTIGALDEEVLFYAEQRGIPEAEAKAMLTVAFVGEVIERIEHEAAREVAAAWAPYCSVATWYIWRSLDPVPVAY